MMDHILNKYFADELTLEEKEAFLLEVQDEGILREEFMENQVLVAQVDWLSPKEDVVLAQQKLSEFMRRMGNAENI